ncbi:MAG: TetR/AcrR family transcriptional regulator [Planctomycetota bacterium]
MGRRPFVRERILVAAFDLVARRSYEAVSTREIAQAAGVGPTSMYRHFATKEELGRELYARALPPVHTMVAEALEQRPETDQAQRLIAGLVHGLYRCYDERPRACALLIFPPHDFMPEELAPGNPDALRSRLLATLGDEDLAAICWGAITGPLADRFLHRRGGSMYSHADNHTALVSRLLPTRP